MIMISLEQVQNFLRKSPEQKRTTARFVATMWLAKLPYAPHQVRLRVTPQDQLHFCGHISRRLSLWTGVRLNTGGMTSEISDFFGNIFSAG